MNAGEKFSYPLLVKRDVDGFFGLMIDNLMQLLLIAVLCGGVCGIPVAIVTGRILPGAAVSVLVGNLFYAWQAHRLARRERRSDVTALPYGINTVSLLAFVFFVMKPGFDAKFAALKEAGVALETAREQAGLWAWKLGVLACVVSGVVEFVGAFFAERLRRITPRAALLAPLAGIAITFLAADFAFRMYLLPVVAILPMAVILLQYFGKVRFPLGLPGGLVALLVGAAVAWVMAVFGAGPMHGSAVVEAVRALDLVSPRFAGDAAWEAVTLGGLGATLSVAVLMGLMSVLGSLQNIESAAAAGDRYNTTASLAADGIGSLAAGLFGSCFPTSIYIGHPGWKGLGARAGYSTLNGLFITLICLTGAVGLVQALIPIEAGLPILLWIGLVITAQAYQATPREHAPAVAIGLIPIIAGFALSMVSQALGVAGSSLEKVLAGRGSFPEFAGMVYLNEGSLYTSLLLAAVTVFLIERRFLKAAWWSGAMVILTLAGLLHGTRIEGNVTRTVLGPARSYPFAVGYALMAGLFLFFHWREGRSGGRRGPNASPGSDSTDTKPVAP